MSWTRCSRVVAALFVLLVAAVAPTAAVSVSTSGVPQQAQAGATIGTSQTIEFTFDDLYTKYDNYTLTGTTHLEQATWTVTLLNNQGNQIRQQSPTGQNMSVTVQGDAAKVVVRLEGKVPDVPESAFQYEPWQSFTLASFAQSQQGGVSTPVESYSVDYYTEDSKPARDALDDAKQAIQTAEGSGADVSQAQKTFDNAVSAYEAANFDLATELANEAATQAEQSQQSKSQTDLLLMAGGGLVVLLVLAGVLYWFFALRETTDKLG